MAFTLLTPRGTREGGVRCTYNEGVIDREEDWHFNVRSDQVDVNRNDVLYNTPGLPLIGVTISNGMLCKGGDAERDPGDAKLWRVSLTFSTSVDQNDANNNTAQQQGDPTLWVPVRRLMWETKEEISQTDANGNPILNTAGQPFEGGIVKRRYLPAWEFVQWEPLSVTDLQILERMSVVNNGTWPPTNGKPAKTWQCRVLDSVVGFYSGYRCRMTTYRVVYDVEKWTEKRPSIGTSYRIGGGSGSLTDYIVKGSKIKGKLTSTGDRVTGEDGVDIAGRTLGVVEVDIHPTTSFSFLRIQ